MVMGKKEKMQVVNTVGPYCSMAEQQCDGEDA